MNILCASVGLLVGHLKTSPWSVMEVFAIRQFTCYEILNMIINLKTQWTFCLVSKENHRHAIMKHNFGCL